MKQKCYFSYCWDDKDDVNDLMQYLKKKIEDKSNGAIQIIWDKNFYVSENFKEKEKLILECDSVMIFFSPAYKKKVDDQSPSDGDYREYEYITEARKKGSIVVIPIIIKGKIEEAVIKEFRDNVVADFSEDKPIIQEKRTRLNPKYATTMTNLIASTIYETSIAHRRKDYVFSSREEAYAVLFCNTDSNNKLPRDCMYKSEAYNNIMSDEGSSFLIGRKGSGKTTFFEVLEKYNPTEFDSRFKILRPISVEDISEEQLYAVIEDLESDKKILTQSRMLELFWETYIYLCSIYIVCIEEENYRIRDDRRTIFHTIGNKLRRAFKYNQLDSANVKKAIFTESVVLWENFLKEGILNYATEEAYLASMVANLDVNNIMSNFLGQRNYSAFLKAIEQCEKKILIALDKFDFLSEDFRRDIKYKLQSNNEIVIKEGEKRAEFDRLLYRSLVTTVEKLKLQDIGLMGKVSFCIILPQDRLEQIKLVDRDFTKRNFTTLAWDAIELLYVILLRLKVLYGLDIDLDGDIVSKFENIMATYLPTIPLKVEIEINGKQEKIDLFQYLLRISFWRPRDIIKYFAILYDANIKNINKYSTIDMQTLKTHLNTVTDEIIDFEFFNEYNKVLFNIEELMNKFKNRNIILSISEMVDILQDIEFEGVLITEDNPIIDKMSILYEFGVIGLKFEEKEIKRRNIGNSLCFAFNEGLIPFRNSREDLIGGDNIKIVINPIFAKRLSLHYNTSEKVCAFEWDYLLQNHIRKMSIRRI